MDMTKQPHDKPVRELSTRALRRRPEWVDLVIWAVGTFLAVGIVVWGTYAALYFFGGK